jgi:hypothetical protein
MTFSTLKGMKKPKKSLKYNRVKKDRKANSKGWQD